METVLLILSMILILTGLAGCLLPVIPGPPLSFLALLFVSFTGYADFTKGFLLIMALVAMAVTLLDFVLPSWAAGKWGGSKYAVWGAAIGLVAGILFFPPVGLIAGPFLGAVLGELIAGKRPRKALIAGSGAFGGFMIGIGIKLFASIVMTLYYIQALI